MADASTFLNAGTGFDYFSSVENTALKFGLGAAPFLVLD